MLNKIITKNGTDLFSADRKWVSAVEVLAAIKYRHLPIENLLLICFNHCIHNFSTKIMKNSVKTIFKIMRSSFALSSPFNADN